MSSSNRDRACQYNRCVLIGSAQVKSRAESHECPNLSVVRSVGAGLFLRSLVEKLLRIVIKTQTRIRLPHRCSQVGADSGLGFEAASHFGSASIQHLADCDAITSILTRGRNLEQGHEETSGAVGRPLLTNSQIA